MDVIKHQGSIWLVGPGPGLCIKCYNTVHDTEMLAAIKISGIGDAQSFANINGH